MQKSNLPAVAKMKIDIKSMDEQLERHMDRVICLMEKKKEPEEWEIDPHKLVLKGVFAKGGFAKVRRGVYDGQEVAVKVLECGEERDPVEIERDFRREVSLWYTLDHPNVTKCIGATTPNSSKKFGNSNKEKTGSPISDSLCIVTEYMSGGNLKSHLLRRKNMKLPYKTVLQLALDLARGLDYLHSKKIVHMDIKTENLLLDKNGMLKIADFGLARIEAPQMKGETGTRGYMSPEILESKPYTKKCEVYSFGICLWEIFCCQELYSNISRSELDNVDKYKTLRPQIPKGCPSSLSTLMKRCWDAEPSRRPEMKEVVAILQALDKSNQPRGCFCF